MSTSSCWSLTGAETSQSCNPSHCLREILRAKHRQAPSHVYFCNSPCVKYGAKIPVKPSELHGHFGMRKPDLWGRLSSAQNGTFSRVHFGACVQMTCTVLYVWCIMSASSREHLVSGLVVHLHTSCDAQVTTGEHVCVWIMCCAGMLHLCSSSHQYSLNFSCSLPCPSAALHSRQAF